jgi:sugar phosphate isomerase/epimerase
MKDSTALRISRRRVLQTGAMIAAATGLGGVSLGADEAPGLIGPPRRDPWRGLKMGVASYSLRKLPLDAAVAAIKRVGLAYVSIKDFHLKLDTTAEQRRAVAAKFKDAGITPISCGVISLPNDEAKVRNAFEYARDCGIPTIVASPEPSALDLVEKFVKEFDIRIAIHNHGPEDKKFPAPEDVIKAVQGRDARVGLCMDIGHTARAKSDPVEGVLKYKDRLFDMHFKDIDSVSPKAKEVEAGRGVLNLGGLLKNLIEIKYAYHVGIEHEKDPDDPVPGLAETVGYAKGLIAAMADGR